MKVITLTPHTKQLQLIDWEEPQINQANEVKLRVLAVGICGTDRELISGGRAASPPGEKQLILGHEMIGEVTEVGSAVKKFKKGDLATVSVRRGCENCVECLNGYEDLCSSGNYTERGIKKRHGFQAQYIVDHEKYVMKVPTALGILGVLIEPMSVVQKAIITPLTIQQQRLHDWNPDDWKSKKALVAGLGPIGLLSVMALRLKGFQVFGIDRGHDEKRLSLLKQMGAHFINAERMNPQEILKSHGKMDLMIEATGRAELCFSYLCLLGTNGIYSITSVPEPGSSMTLDAGKTIHDLVLHNQILIGSVNAHKDHWLQGIIDLEKAHKLWPGLLEQFITTQAPHTDYQHVLTSRAKGDIKTIINWTL